jgi:hypothetical protein
MEFRVSDFEFRVYGLGCIMYVFGFRYRFHGLEFRVKGEG